MRFSQSDFSPDDIALMGRAIDGAIEHLKGAGIAFKETARDRMANFVMAALSEGERDAERLMQYALEAANGFNSPGPAI